MVNIIPIAIPALHQYSLGKDIARHRFNKTIDSSTRQVNSPIGSQLLQQNPAGRNCRRSQDTRPTAVFLQQRGIDESGCYLASRANRIPRGQIRSGDNIGAVRLEVSKLLPEFGEGGELASGNNIKSLHHDAAGDPEAWWKRSVSVCPCLCMRPLSPLTPKEEPLLRLQHSPSLSWVNDGIVNANGTGFSQQVICCLCRRNILLASFGRVDRGGFLSNLIGRG